MEMFRLHEDNGLVLKEWQGDKTMVSTNRPTVSTSRPLGIICPESNRYPDFVLDYQGKGFAVECKWREKLLPNIEKDLFPRDKMAIYQQFSIDRNIPVYIVLGVGGEPSNPELLYKIPLSEIPSVLSHAKSIVEFLRPSSEAPFCTTDFISIGDSKQ